MFLITSRDTTIATQMYNDKEENPRCYDNHCIVLLAASPYQPHKEVATQLPDTEIGHMATGYNVVHVNVLVAGTMAHYNNVTRYTQVHYASRGFIGARKVGHAFADITDSREWDIPTGCIRG